ncbi:MAG: hypothetical protein AAF961_08015 [Planctomycetota bacterium]
MVSHFAKAVLWLALLVERGVADNSAATPQMQLINGDYVAGQLVDSHQSDTLAWQTPAAAQPFQFAVSSVASVQFPVGDAATTPVGEYSLQLVGGDVLFGSLLSNTDGWWELQSPSLGLMQIDPSHVRRITRWGESLATLYRGLAKKILTC